MPPRDFIRARIASDVAQGRNGGEVVTRFPPEPNGYLHLGHAKAICLDFEVAREWDGRCRLRFDDTNPGTEREEYAVAMQEDIRWLGYLWDGNPRYASDYFERIYLWAEQLVKAGHAYVDSQSLAEIRAQRGSVVEPGVDSPWRNRTGDENLDLLRRMRAGEFPDGAHVLRARIDMAHPNMVMRDPVLYRIRHARHYRTGAEWCIYPMYDFAHCLGDAIEGVTHSLCTLEFENNREIYDWIIDRVDLPGHRPRQYEFARFDLEGTVLSKRRIRPLVEAGSVDGWDDPRLDTLRGLRRRGVPADALRRLMAMVGVTRANSTVDRGKFRFAVRSALDPVAPRVMAVLRPLPLTVSGDVPSSVVAPRHPDASELLGDRTIPCGNQLFVERTDFSDDPPPGFRRLVLGEVVRLRHGPLIRCDEAITDESGRVSELRASVVQGLRPRGTIHWVCATRSLDAEVRLYRRLFRSPETTAAIDPRSLEIVDAKIEVSVAEDADDTRYQFERLGYFWRDPKDGCGDRLVFNRIVTLSEGRVSEGGARTGDAGAGTKAEDGPATEAEAKREVAVALRQLHGQLDGWAIMSGTGAFPAALTQLRDSLVGDGRQHLATREEIRSERMRESVAELAAAAHAVALLAAELNRNATLRAEPEAAVDAAAKAVARTRKALESLRKHEAAVRSRTLTDEGTLEDLERAASCIAGLGDRLVRLRESVSDLPTDGAAAARRSGLAGAVAELRKLVRNSRQPIREDHFNLVTRSKDGVHFLRSAVGSNPEALSHAVAWMATVLRARLDGGGYGDLPMAPSELGALSKLMAEGSVTPSAAKLAVTHMAEHGGTAGEAVDGLGLTRIHDSETISRVVHDILEHHPTKVLEYRAGKKSLLGMFMGEAMRVTGRGVDPRAVREALSRALDLQI